jgi:hypothetical protein
MRENARYTGLFIRVNRYSRKSTSNSSEASCTQGFAGVLSKI